MPGGLHPSRPSGARLAHAVATVRRALGWEPRCLQGLTWARVGWTCALVIVTGLNATTGGVIEVHRRFDVPIAAYVEEFLWLQLLVPWFVLMLLATIADNLPLRGTMRKLAFVLAVALGVLAMPFEKCLDPRWQHREVCADFPSRTYFANLDWVDLFGFAVVAAIVGIMWFSYRRDAATAAALHAVAVERNRLQRRAVDASLKVRQARADPEFLLDNVTAIAASCVEDSGRAERMIDELVAYLRAALPDAREEASTLGRELRMIDAYLELVSLRTEGRVRRTVEVPTPLHELHISPALLLPLVSSLVPHRSVVPGDGIDVRIAATPARQSVRIVIVRQGAVEDAVPNPLALTDLRARLRDLYGDAASLTVDASVAGETQAVLVLPRTVERVGERNATSDDRAAVADVSFDPTYQGA